VVRSCLERLVQRVEDLLVEAVCEPEREGDRGQGDDQASAKLVEVLDERNAVAVGEATRQAHCRP
jgi:hypothetical protein